MGAPCDGESRATGGKPSRQNSSQKRKRANVASRASNPAAGSSECSIGSHDHSLPQEPKTPAKKKLKAGDTPEEKRLRRFRPRPPQSFHDNYLRATTQRFYVLSRSRHGTADCPEETIEMAGSTGNVYRVIIALQPSCDCPHAREGNQCKHLLYVLARVLRARFDLVYQLALLSSELREIFANAPVPPQEQQTGLGGARGEATKDRNRKPVEGDCPICFSELQAGNDESIVWCRAACGQNIHKECFEMWASTKRQQSGGGARSDVTCPFCRSVWQGDEDSVKKIKKRGDLNDEGYVNVADQLGISTERDTSTYSQWWSGHRGAGYFNARGSER